jgi:hypothetical protein
MKFIVAALLLVGSIVASGAAYAGPDDVKWIAQCMKDNSAEGATEDVIHKYCTCMDNKMSDDETKSISEWEKTHPTEMAACDKESGRK